MNFNIQDLPEWAQQVIVFSQKYNDWLIGAALLLFVLLIWTMIIGFFKNRGKDVIAFEDESGTVSISKHALKTLIFNKCNRVQGVQNPRPIIKCKGNRILIKVKVGIKEGSNLREIREVLRIQLEESLRSDFGLERLDTINIYVTDFETRNNQDFSLKKKVEEPVVVKVETESKPEESEPLFAQEQDQGNDDSDENKDPKKDS